LDRDRRSEISETREALTGLTFLGVIFASTGIFTAYANLLS
jgi:hypothetical protein